MAARRASLCDEGTHTFVRDWVRAFADCGKAI